MIITLEGTDGTGKNTQAKLLTEWLSKEFPTKLLTFPDYSGTFFGHEVGKYLNGDYGNLEDINPKFASLLFALDRFENKETIMNLIDKNYIIVMDRYIESNIIYQCSRVPKEERENLKTWLEKVEYDILELPESDEIIFLDLPPEHSRKLVLKKEARNYTYSKEDIHEGNENLISDSYEFYKETAIKEDWIIINCLTESNEVKTIEQLHEDIKINVLNLPYRWNKLKIK